MKSKQIEKKKFAIRKTAQQTTGNKNNPEYIVQDIVRSKPIDAGNETRSRTPQDLKMRTVTAERFAGERRVEIVFAESAFERRRLTDRWVKGLWIPFRRRWEANFTHKSQCENSSSAIFPDSIPRIPNREWRVRVSNDASPRHLTQELFRGYFVTERTTWRMSINPSRAGRFWCKGGVSMGYRLVL